MSKENEELETRLCDYFDNLPNSIPYQYYIASDRGGLASDDAIDSFWLDPSKPRRNEKDKSRKHNLQKSRYDPSNWRCTTDVLSQTASRNSEPQKPKPIVSKNSQSTSNKNIKNPETTAASESRQDLRRKLQEKIASLQQQQKKKKYSNEEIKTFRKLKRSHKNGIRSSDEQAPQQRQVHPKPSDERIRKREDFDSDFKFNRIVVKGTPSQEKRKEEERLETGETVVKRRRMADALKDLEKKEKVRANWSPEEREAVERKEALDKAVLKAAGEKVFDNPAKLKKAFKAREQKHAKSKRNWSERKKAVEEQQGEAAKKRTSNVAKRIGKINSKKLRN